MGLRVRMVEASVLASLAFVAIGCGGDEKVARPSQDSVVSDASSADAGSPDDAGDPASDAAVLVPLPTRSADQHCVLQGTPSDALPRIGLERVEGVRFPRAAQVLARSSEPDALYVVEQGGQLVRIEPDAEAPAREVLLDMSSVLASEGAALLGAAFHPDYDDNGLLFVHYVSGTPLRSVVASFRVDVATGQAPVNSERRVLAVTHPGEGRNGGALLFDGDGMLLVALGDGGELSLGVSRDPLLGSILRLEVSADGAPGYNVPPDNPFVSTDEPAARPPEVLAYGFADPSACHIDPADGQLWCVDRGRLYSELNSVQRGRDHGWPVVENVICVETQ
jgi:glucose/arabinose dehydrogenase